MGRSWILGLVWLALAQAGAEDWEKKTEQALASGQRLDAMIYYQKLLVERRGSAALGGKMRTMWLELGGTAESWDAYLKYAPLVKLEDGAEWAPLEKALPAVELASLTGERQALWEGKRTVVVVWASWCAPCLEELPQVEELHLRLKDRPGLRVVTVNIDDNSEVARRVMKERGYTFPVLMGRKEVPVASVPRNWIVDERGVARKEQRGFGGKWVEGVLRALGL